MCFCQFVGSLDHVFALGDFAQDIIHVIIPATLQHPTGIDSNSSTQFDTLRGYFGNYSENQQNIATPQALKFQVAKQTQRNITLVSSFLHFVLALFERFSSFLSRRAIRKLMRILADCKLVQCENVRKFIFRSSLRTNYHLKPNPFLGFQQRSEPERNARWKIASPRHFSDHKQ